MQQTIVGIIRGGLVFSVLIAAPAMAGSVVKDGSLESGHFVDTQDNYMELPNDSTTIRDWTVFTSSGDIVWAKSPTGDGLNAADGKYFIDLTGFGSNAQDGAISQNVHLTKGVTYTFSLDAYASNDTTPVVTVGAQTITLTPGTPFSVHGTTWVPMTGQIVGSKATKSATLKVSNNNNGAQLLFIDNISISPAN